MRALASRTTGASSLTNCYNPVRLAMQNADGEGLARVRAAARAEIDWLLAGFESSSLAPPKCAGLLRVWHALASLEAQLQGASPPTASEFAAALARRDRGALPRALRDVKDDFVATVVQCAQAEPGTPVSSPGSRAFDDHRRLLLRAYAELNRQVRRQLPPRRVPWRKVALAALGVVIVAVPLWMLYRPRWRVSYYPNITLSGDPGLVTRILDPDRNWGHVGPGHGLPNDHFSARYETCLVLGKPSDVVFTVGSDDGGALFVDDRKIIDLWGDHPYTTSHQTVTLERGMHTLRLEYFQGGGDARLTFEGHLADSSSDVTAMLRLPAQKGPVCDR